MRKFAELESKIGRHFQDQKLLAMALTHGSKQDAEGDYQRLEFLGDRVLSLVIAEELFKRFPDAREGQLAARLSVLVRAESCAKVGENLALAEHIQVGAVEKRKGVQATTSVVADVVEGLIGALYIDAGIDLARDFILKQWHTLFEHESATLKDPKTFVQEWALGNALPLPVYDLVNRKGPQHAPVFTIALQVSKKAAAFGTGTSKQLAEMDAARIFIDREGLR